MDMLRIIKEASGKVHLQNITEDGGVFELKPTAKDAMRAEGLYDFDWKFINPEGSRYDHWMGKQDVAFQDDVLGPRQARLFRQGRVVLKRFTPRAGDALTLDQARARDHKIIKR